MKTTGRRLICVFLAALIFMGMSMMCVSADNYKIDDGFEFAEDSNGYITIHKYIGTESVVTIPSTLLNKSVVAVDEYAFMYNDVIKSVSMPTTITSVGRGTFFGCTALESAQLPRNCTGIGQYMFYGCTSLKSVSMPNMLKEVPRYCFSHCDSLETVTLPSTARSIGDYAFSDCPNLKSVYVSRYTNSISPNAFEDSPQAVIYGYMNTYAYNFALENSIPFCPVDATEVFYVTFYNYDGTIYQKVPVSKGNSIDFIPAPEKPATSTHYYEFAYWNGNVVNIQQNEFVYPVYNEIEREDTPEVINKYSVIFLDGDDVFMEAQMVEEGGNASAPEAIPVKASTVSHYYVFSGWDTSFASVTENLIVRPIFEEHLIEYKVSFRSTDDEVLSEQTLHYGESATAPEPPEIEGYTFTGWDKEFDFVTEDMVVTAVYEKNEAPKEPAPAKTIGRLIIELAGGNSFTIAVDGGNARPQGASYVNTKMPVGAHVTVVADAVEGVEFLGWMNRDGAIVSLTDTYTFNATGNDYFKAVYKTTVDGVNLVIFNNDKAAGGRGQIIDMQYYASDDEVNFPADPTRPGYVFAGWNMTAQDIGAKLSAGEDAVVVPIWEVAKVYIDVVINGGTISTQAQENGKYLAYNALTVAADEAPAGMKFAYWTDADGNIVSYDAIYKSYPSKSVELTAVYVAENDTVEKKPLVFLSADPTTAGEKITYTISWDIDASIGTVTAYGLMVVDANDYNADTFYHGSGDSNLFDRAVSTNLQKQEGTSIALGDRLYDHTYCAVSFLIYTDAVTGESVTIYSAMAETYKPAL